MTPEQLDELEKLLAEFNKAVLANNPENVRLYRKLEVAGLRALPDLLAKHRAADALATACEESGLAEHGFAKLLEDYRKAGESNWESERDAYYGQFEREGAYGCCWKFVDREVHGWKRCVLKPKHEGPCSLVEP